MTLSAFQFQYAGVLLGDTTPYNVIKVQGLKDLPPFRTADQDRGRDHGQWIGNNYAAGRSVIVDMEVTSQDGTDATFWGNVASLDSATALTQTESPLVFLLPGMSGQRRINARPRRRVMPVDMPYQFHVAAASVEFYATDPRIYDDTLTQFTIPVGVPASGLSFNATPNFTFGTGGTTGVVNAVNAGNIATRPVVVISGPVDNPTIENTTAGLHLTFSLSLLSTDTLTVDLDAKSVLLNGTGSRRSTMTTDSRWWELAPGTSQVTYRANTVQVGSTALLSFRSAWL